MKIILFVIIVALFATSAFSEGPPNQRNPVARVHDRLLYKEECKNENCIIQALIEDFGSRNSIVPTETELDCYCNSHVTSRRKTFEKNKFEFDKLTKQSVSGKLNERQKQTFEILRRTIEMDEKERSSLSDENFFKICHSPAGDLFLRRWKIMNALYKRYKGRIAITKFGPVPVDAIRSMITEEEKNDGFKIFDKDIENRFIKSHEVDNVKFYEQKQGEAELARPPWINKKCGASDVQQNAAAGE